MIPVKGTLDYRCFLGAPWRIDFPASEFGEIPYHVILGGSAVLVDPAGGQRASWSPVTFCCSPWIGACARRRSDAAPAPDRWWPTLNVVFDENEGTGDRLDMMCGRFILSAAHDRLICRVA